MKENIYWYAYTLESVRNLLMSLFLGDEVKKTATLYGEVYGRVRGGHKSLHYGKPNALGFVAFGLQIDGKYVSWDSFKASCEQFGVPMVPVVDIFEWDMKKARSFATGDSLLAEKNGASHMREGIVICPLKEREDFRTGRAILKMLNPDYLILKGKSAEKGEVTDFTDV
jgi:hypothetical protein